MNAAAAAGAADNATPAVPSPLDEITDLTGAPDQPAGAANPGLLSSAEGELREVPHDMPLTVNDTVLSFLNFFQTTRGRAIVETGLNRAGRYRGMIEQVLREEGLPSDLMYIAQAESAFQPQALSRDGARGLWQFMAYRGKEYGLEHTAWVDDRQDPEKATRAAAHHLHDLYNMFGDWYLVMAAYNSGPGTVEHAVERSGYADFWQLYRLNMLPKETKDYVPIIVALTLIAKDPARYGIEVKPADPLQTDNVIPGSALNLRLVAEALDIDIDKLRELNPQLLHLTTPADPNFVLHLPAGTGDRFAAEMAASPADKWLSWREHRVAAGETLPAIAKQYRVTPAAIAEVNGLPSDGSAAGIQRISLEAGTKLVIPAPTAEQAALGSRLRYRTRRTDTLESVADEFDVSVSDLKKWNHLRSTVLPVGTRLMIYPASIPGTSTSTTTTASAKSTRPAAPPTGAAAHPAPAASPPRPQLLVVPVRARRRPPRRPAKKSFTACNLAKLSTPSPAPTTLRSMPCAPATDSSLIDRSRRAMPSRSGRRDESRALTNCIIR